MKLPKRIFCLLLAVCLILPMTACGEGGIETPTGYTVDLENTLSWEPVGDARSYCIEIKTVESGETVEEITRHTEYSLSDLAEGDYEIRLRSIGGKNNDVFSLWSEVIAFHKDYESGLRYTLINNGSEYEVSRVGTASGVVTIEDEYRGKPVTSIGDTAFRESKKVESVIMGKNIRSIGEAAFYNCVSLKSISIPNSVTSIGKSAFQSCTALESVELSASIEALPERVFAYCSALKEIKLPETLKEIGPSAFTNCTGLKSLVLPDSVVSVSDYAFYKNTALQSVVLGMGLQTLGEYAFSSCASLAKASFSGALPEDANVTLGDYAFGACPALADVEIPAGVVSIGRGCFEEDAALNAVELPDTLTELGYAAFAGTEALESQKGENVFYVDDWVVGLSGEYATTVSKLAETDWKNGVVGIGEMCFVVVVDNTVTGCPQLEEVRLPSSLKYIGEYSFALCPMLKRVFATGGGLREIGSYAFYGCKVLSNVQFSNGLQKIGSYAFYDCDILDNNENNPHLLVPETVTKIGTYAFKNTRLWDSTVDGDGVVYAGNWVVGLTQNLSIVELKEETEGVGDYAFYYYETLQTVFGPLMMPSSLTNVIGLQSVRNIGAGAFYQCVSLASVSLNQQLRTLAPYTFSGCSSLFRVSLPRMLESIGSHAFYKCNNLNALDLSSTRVEKIGERAFYGCERMLTLDLGDDVKEIGFRAFYGCAALPELTIPDSVEVIGGDAFAKCSALTSVSFGNGLVSIGDNAFRYTALSEIVIPDSVKEIGDCAFYGLQGEHATVKLGNSLETIGDYAFCGAGLEGNLVIPASVKTIGIYAFAVSSRLSSAVFLGSPLIGQHAFYSCPNLTIFVKEGLEHFEGGWDSSFRPVVYGCTVDEDGELVSVTAGDVQYGHTLGGVGGPAKSGYDFAGWATSEGGEVAYTPNQFFSAEEGVTLYPVYTEHVETEEPEEPEEPAPEEPEEPEEPEGPAPEVSASL